MKKIFFVFVILMSVMLLRGQPLDVRQLSEKDFTPEMIEVIRQQNSSTRTGWSFNYSDIPHVMPVNADDFVQGNTPWIKDFAADINNYTAGDAIHFYWSNSERFEIETVPGNPSQLKFTTINQLWWGEETIAITINDEPLSPGEMGAATWLFSVRVKNVLDAPIFNFPNVEADIPDGYIFTTPEDTPFTVNFIGTMPGSTLPYIESVDNLNSPTAIQLFITPTSPTVSYTQANSGAGLGTSVTFIPPSNVWGAHEDYTFLLTAKDRSYGLISSRTIKVRVTQVNDPPEIQSVKVDTLEVIAMSEIGPFGQGQNVAFEAVGFDMDGDTVFYSWILDGEFGSTEIGTSAAFNYTFNTPGYYTLTLKVRDRADNSGFEVSQSWDVTVSPLGPQFDPWADQGPFSQDINVVITAPGTEVEGIYYSLDGPTGPWTLYQTPVHIPLQTNPPAAYSQTLWAYYVPLSGPDSVVNHQTYQMTGTVQTPVFSHASGRYLPNNPDASIGSNFRLQLSTVPADATIEYSADGGATWLPYDASAGIQIPTQSAASFVARAAKAGWVSSSTTAVHNYVINDKVVFANPMNTTVPVVDADGNYCVCFGDSVQVNFAGIISTPADAIIRYSIEPLGLPGMAQVYTYDPALGEPFTLYILASSTIRWWAEYTDPALDATVAEWFDSNVYSFDYPVLNRTRMLFWENGTVFDPIPKSLPTDLYDNAIDIAINTAVEPNVYPSAEIWYQYQTDDMAPAFSDSLLYTGPIHADRDIIIRAWATALPPFTTLPSIIHEGVYSITGTLPVPLVAHTSPPGDVYTSPWAAIGGEHTYEENVVLSLQMPPGDRWANAEIYYTLDGGDSYVPYTAPFELNMGHYQFNAYATLDNWITSPISDPADYFVKFLPPVTFTTNDGPLQIPDPAIALSEHYQQIQVSLFTYDAAEIRYTLDGSVPTPASPLYSGPITFGSDPLIAAEEYVLKAIAVKPGWVDSEPITWTFKLVPTLFNPVFEPAATNHPLPIMVSIVADLNLAPYQIYYLEDPTGTDIPGPDNGTLYTGAFPVDTSRVIAARVYKDGFRPSEVVYKAYQIANTIGDIVFNPAEGTYTSAISVGLSSVPPEAIISYSFDNLNWEPYSGLINLPLGTEQTIYAKAEMGGSETKFGQADYTILQIPEISPLQTEYAAGESIDITISAPVGNLYYSIDGAPAVLGISPVVLSDISTNTTVEAWAENDGVETARITRTYIFNSALVPPVANVVSGTYYETFNVVLSHPQNADIYFSEDNISFSLYAGQELSITENQNLWAYAVRDNYPNSIVREWNYLLKVRNPQATLASGEYAGAREVSFSVNTPGAELIYNTSSALLPIEEWLEYDGSPIPITESTTFWVLGTKNNWLSSEPMTFNYIINGAVAQVAFTPAAGTRFAEHTVSLSTVTPDATIYYSTDDSVPTMVYGAPIPVDENTLIRAFATKTNWLASTESSAQYYLKVSPINDGGIASIHYDSFSVSLSTPTPGTEIYYTLGGGTPDILYTDSILITESSTLRAVARRIGMDWLDSDLYERGFVINQRVAAPTFDPDGGLFMVSPVEVEINTSTADAQIFYRTSVNGAWLPYDAVLEITETTLIQAKAVKDGWVDSEISSTWFIIELPVTPQVATPEFSPVPGTYNVPQSVVITSTAGATIYYTTDGNDPTVDSSVYDDEPILVNENTTIKAFARLDGHTDSELATGEYIIAPDQVLNPIVFPASGTFTEPFTVAIFNTTAGATLQYQLNDETVLWTDYDPAEPIYITESTTLRVRAIKDLMFDSEVVERIYTVTGSIAMGAADMPSGIYHNGIMVSFGATNPVAAEIRYTLDGTEPTLSSMLYTAPIAIDAMETSEVMLKARAFLDDWNPSQTLTYTYNFHVAPIVFSPAGGNYSTPQTVVLSSLTDDAVIYFTVDGSVPDAETGTLYTEAIAISGNTTLRARGYNDPYVPTPVASATYAFDYPQVASPVFTPGSTTSTTPLEIEISTSTPDAVIYYTTDGSDPTQASTQYSAAITVPLNSTMFLRARAYRTDWLPSSIVSATYTVTGQVAGVTFNPAGGTYTNAQLVVLSSTTTGASIRYTTDGSEPSETEGTIYTTPISVNASMTIKAIAYRSDWDSSSVNSEDYIITGSIAMGAADMPSGIYHNGIMVSFGATNPVAAEIRYTLDGTEPTLGSMLYTAPIAIDAMETSEVMLKAKAFLDGWNASQTVTYNYTFRAASVQFDPAGGTYTAVQQVGLISDTIGASIYYTLDGSAPTEDSTPYTGPITVATNTVIRARAYNGVYLASPITSATYAIDLSQFVVANPIFSPASTNSFTPLSVTIATDTEGASIRYTTNGMDPSSDYGTVYTGVINVPLNTTMFIKAIAYMEGWTSSAVVAAYYNVTGTVAEVTFNHDSGIYTGALDVELSSATEGATIRYTTDGSDPTALSNVYNRPISLSSGTTTIKAMAFRSGWQASGITSETYTITGSVAFNQPIFSPAGGTYGNGQSVTIANPVPASALVYYTLDGSVPDPMNPNTYLYTAGDVINITGDTTINAIAVLDGWNTSEMVSATYAFRADAPLFSVAGGWYETAQTVALSTPTVGASIRYTLDGSTPSATNGMDYSGPIYINVNRSIKAYAYKVGYQNSAVITQTYAIGEYVPVVATPVFNVESGIYQSPQTVTIDVATSGATIRYTTDGSDPSETYGSIYTGSISVSSNMSLKAIAYRTDWQTSQIAVANYVITGTVAAVQFNPGSGTYTTAQTVVLTSATEGAYFYYTTDGSDPSPVNGTLYTTGIYVPLNSSVTIRARAYKENWTPSVIGSASYTITGQVFIADPVFSLIPGTYTSAQTLSLGTADPSDAEIRYTTDGSDPSLATSAYLVYNPANPINLELGAVRTIRVSAHKANWVTSPVYTAIYNMTGTVVLPSDMFTPVAGTYPNPQTVTLDTNTYPAGAMLRYTLNGGEPTEASPAYNPQTGIAINGSATLRVKGFMPGWEASATSEASYNITGTVVINSPVFTPPAGTYTSAQNVVIGTTNPADATIRYTLDGSEPHEGSPLYTAAISLPQNSTTTIRVKAFMNEWTESTTYQATYTITGQVTMTTPVFSPAPDTYTSPIAVTLNTTTIPSGAEIYYTTDGSDPNEGSMLYSGVPIQINANEAMTIRARAFYQDWVPSIIHSGNYSVTGTAGIVGNVFTPEPGLYNTAQTVVISTNTYPLGAIVRYTTDGSEPGAESPIYAPNTPIQLGLNTITTINAKVFAPGWISSPTYTGIYNITGAVSVAGVTLTPAPGVYATVQNVFYSGLPLPNDAVLRYTTNGVDPIETDPVFSAALTPPLNSTLNLKVRAFKDGWIPSAVIAGTYTFTGQVALPAAMFTPVAGTYQTAQTITLNTATVPTGATLRYTTNGTEPTLQSPAYTGPISLPLGSGITQIRVRGFLEGWTPSATVSATYNITGMVTFNTPVFTPAAGTYATALQISVNATSPADAVTRYTTDGSEPTASSPVLSGTINLNTLNTTHTVKVKAFKADWTASATQTAVYVLTGQAAIAAPQFSPAPGTYTTAQTVSINATVTPSNATIRYTLDGSDPTASSPIYSAPIEIALNSNVTIRARAFAANWTPSDVYVGNYKVTGQVAFDASPIFSPAAGTYTSAQVITISQPNPAGATVRYTLDGSDPDEDSAIYSSGISLPLDSMTTIKIKAWASDWIASDVHEAAYTITGQVSLSGTLFSPEPGLYTEAQDVMVSADIYPTTATIHYTIDGSTPTQDSPVYTAGMTINIPLNTQNFSLKIRAFADDWLASPIYTADYRVTGTVQLADAIFSPVPGTYTTAQNITLAAPVLPTDAMLRYTTDGSDPTAQSPAYTAPIAIPTNSENFVLKVKGFSDGWISSAVITGIYKVTGTLSEPEFNYPSAMYAAPLEVTISSNPGIANVSIYYTTDGSEPTQASMLYTEAIEVPAFAQNFTIRARAYRQDWITSGISQAVYSVLLLPMNVRTIAYEGYVRVLWNNPSVRALEGFNVYRQASNETSFRKLNDTLIPVTQMIGNDHYYDDYEVSNNMSYQYYVKAVYNGVESNASDITIAEYQSAELVVTENTRAYPNPAETGTTIQIRLSRNDNVQITVSIFDFAGKKVRTLTGANLNTNLVEIPWDLKNDSGTKVARGTYFARIQATDSAKRSEKVIKISVK
jgi:hypothetical protein